MHPTDSDTFAAIAKGKSPITAAELKDRSETNLTQPRMTCLSKFTGLGLIRRQRSVSSSGREQYEYTVLS